MQPLKNAFKFIGVAFSLALKHPRLQEPWFFLGLGSLVILFIWFLPIALVTGLVGLTPLGLTLLGFLSCLGLSSLFLWGEVVALRTARVFASIGVDSDPAENASNRFSPAHGWDLASLKLSLPLLQIGKAIRSRFKPTEAPAEDQKRWLEAPYLALPVMAVEDRDLSGTLSRIGQIVQDNLLRFQVNLVGIHPVGWGVQLLLTTGGLALGFWVGLKVADPLTVDPWQRILAAGISMLVAWVPTFLGTLFSSTIRVCYDTALYQWVCNVEAARQGAEPSLAQPPAILGQVFSGSSKIKKER